MEEQRLTDYEIRYLKVLMEAACLQVAERLFQSFAPLNKKDFFPLSVPFSLTVAFHVYCTLIFLFTLLVSLL